MEDRWTILELADLAAETLAASQPAGPSADAGTPAGPARASGRVRDVPNERLVRWYVTVGLVDPPLSRRGRVAQYGRRHLLQLVAVKRRQAEGRSLAEIQAELAGATDEALAAVARVPDARPGPSVPARAPARFWARQARQPGQPEHAAEGMGRSEHGAEQMDQTAAPTERPGQPDPCVVERPPRSAPAAGPPGQSATAGPPGPPVRAAARGGLADAGGGLPPSGLSPSGLFPSGLSPSGLVHGVRLAPGVTLLLEGAGRDPGPDDVTEIVNAARPLLAELASRRLRTSGPGLPPDDPDHAAEPPSPPRGA